MNHSEAVLARNFVVEQINQLHLELAWYKSMAAFNWEFADVRNPATLTSFRCMNDHRNGIRVLKKKLKALEALSKELGKMAKEANWAEYWKGQTQLTFDEVLTDDDYQIPFDEVLRIADYPSVELRC